MNFYSFFLLMSNYNNNEASNYYVGIPFKLA